MDIIKYIFVLLFVGINLMVGVSIIVRPLAGYFGELLPWSGARRQKAKATSAKRRAWTASVWHERQPAQAACARV
jgi:hypothetical protein